MQATIPQDSWHTNWTTPIELGKHNEADKARLSSGQAGVNQRRSLCSLHGIVLREVAHQLIRV
jgi:hypothetical protein